jgi:hypothetical protein
MQRQTRRRPPSTFWEDFTEFLLDEFKAIGKIVGMMLLALYLLVSMLVGMYQVAIWLLWALWWGL